MKAAKAIQNAGEQIRGVLALVDREEGGREALEKEGFAVIALTRASDIIAQMNE